MSTRHHGSGPWLITLPCGSVLQGRNLFGNSVYLAAFLSDAMSEYIGWRKEPGGRRRIEKNNGFQTRIQPSLVKNLMCLSNE